MTEFFHEDKLRLKTSTSGGNLPFSFSMRAMRAKSAT